MDTNQQKISVVTGGAGGIGTAIVRRLHALGDIVYAVDRDEASLTALATTLNTRDFTGRVVPIGADVSSDSQNRDLIARIGEAHGRLDRLVNNAGVAQKAEEGGLSHTEWNRVMDVNLWSMASLTQAATSLWRAVEGPATVVNMSSRSWLAGGPLAYVASKAGVIGLTHALAAELGQYGVRVNAVCPGTVDTQIVHDVEPDGSAHQAHLERVRRMSLTGELIDADDVAATVQFLATTESSSTTGDTIHVSAGAQLAPRGMKG